MTPMEERCDGWELVYRVEAGATSAELPWKKEG